MIGEKFFKEPYIDDMEYEYIRFCFNRIGEIRNGIITSSYKNETIFLQQSIENNIKELQAK